MKGFWENGQLKEDFNFNSISYIKAKRIFSTDKVKGKIINNDKTRFTYMNNIEMIFKISGDKKFYTLLKGNEDENEIKKESFRSSVRGSFDSVYSINSMLRKTNKK